MSLETVALEGHPASRGPKEASTEEPEWDVGNQVVQAGTVSLEILGSDVQFGSRIHQFVYM